MMQAPGCSGGFLPPGRPKAKRPLGGSKPAQRAQRGAFLPPGRPKAKGPSGAASPRSGRGVGAFFRGVHGRPAPARVESSPDDTLIRLGMYEL